MIESAKRALLPFTLCLIVLLVFPSLAPQCRLLAFGPFITFSMAHERLPTALWYSLIAGLVVDLYSNGAPVGFFALNYTLTTAIVYRHKVFFPFEKGHIFSIYTVLYSFVSTILHFVLFALVEMHLKLHFFTLLTDLFLMPILDGVYAFAWVFFPLKVYEKITSPARVRQMKIVAYTLFYRFKRKWQKVRAAK